VPVRPPGGEGIAGRLGAAPGPLLPLVTGARGPHNRLVEEHGWRTRKRKDGTTEWIPRPHLDRGQRRTNGYHHPERYLGRNNDEDGEEH
jgi:hypothetical protein